MDGESARADSSLSIRQLEAAITELCRRALTPHGAVAAVCIWPEFVAQAKVELANTPVRVATVVNFPEGDAPLEETRAEARLAIGDGADEIDMVVPWQMIAWGHPLEARFPPTYLLDVADARWGRGTSRAQPPRGGPTS